MSNFQTLKFEKKLVIVKKGKSLLDEFSIKLGGSLPVLGPPVSRCLLCDQKLAMNNKPIQIVIHNRMGPVM
jgi:hypothetical protein